MVVFSLSAEDSDCFYPDECIVGDIVSATICFDGVFFRDITFYDTNLFIIMACEQLGESTYKVRLQCVYFPELVKELVLRPGEPYYIEVSDFPSQKNGPKNGPKNGSKSDSLARMEALYDSAVAARVLHSPGVLNTRNNAYKKT